MESTLHGSLHFTSSFSSQKQPPEVMFYKKVVFKLFTIFTGKHLCWSLFQIKLLAFKRLQHRCFPVNIANFLRTSILKNICKWLLLFSCEHVFLETGLFDSFTGEKRIINLFHQKLSPIIFLVMFIC